MSIIRAVTDFKFYNEIYRKKLRYSLLYILVLSLIVYYVGVFVNISKINRFVKTEVTTYINNMPEFNIQDGTLDVSVQQPYIFQKDRYAVIVDTTGKSDIKVLRQYDTVLLLAEDQLFIKSNFRINKYKYSDLLGKTEIKSLDKKYLKTIGLFWLKKVIKTYLIIFYMFWYLIWLPFYKIWSILLLSFIALYVDHKQKSGLTYKSLFNISIYAITLPWFIKVLYKALNLHNYLPGIILFFAYWSVATIYVYYAIKEIKHSQNMKPVNEEEQKSEDKDELKPSRIEGSDEIVDGFQQIDEFTLD